MNLSVRRTLPLLAALLPTFDAFSAVSPPPVTTSQANAALQSSRALESILKNGGEMSTSTFFETVWQQTPALFRGDRKNQQKPPNSDTLWNDDAMKSYPYEELVQQGWKSLTDLLEQPPTEQPPLVINNGDVQHPQEWMPAYQTTSLYAPYLNGSSIMQAHADWLSPWLAAFCEDIQQSFPYVYANTYLTPPQSRALNLHADDRDVLVIQLVGSKDWQVMKEVPIIHPYPHEEVGKGDFKVPPRVVERGPSLTCTLEPGDVLYIPRGHCHQAKCTDDLSFHVTIAVPTFDWTLAGMVHMASKSVLTGVPEYKKGLLPQQAMGANPEEALQKHVDNAMELLRQQITPKAILNNLEARIEPHRQRAKVQRERQLERARSNVAFPQSIIPVGPLAARHINFQTKLRVATEEEKKELQRQPPLHLRDELAPDVELILSHFQSRAASLQELKCLEGTSPLWCDLAWLGFAKQGVEAGVLAVVEY